MLNITLTTIKIHKLKSIIFEESTLKSKYIKNVTLFAQTSIKHIKHTLKHNICYIYEEKSIKRKKPTMKIINTHNIQIMKNIDKLSNMT